MIAPQLLFDWMHQAPIYSETDNLGEVWTTASVTCPQDLFHFRCLRHQFSTFEADPYPTRSCPWKCTNIRLCRLCPLLVIYYLHFYKIDRISRATFFFLDFQEFLTLFALLKPFMIFCGILTFLVSSRFFSFLRVEVLKRRAKELEKLSQRKPQRSVPNSRQNFPNHLQKSSPTFSSQKRWKQTEHKQKRAIGQ